AGERADPPPRAGADEGDLEGARGAAADGADLPRVVRRGIRGGRELLPDLEPDDARPLGGRAARRARPCGTEGDRAGRGGQAGVAPRRGVYYRRQALASLWDAALREESKPRRGNELPQRGAARGGSETDPWAQGIH